MPAASRQALPTEHVAHPSVHPAPRDCRFLTAAGMRVTVANARKLRAIYQNDRKCDRFDSQMLAKLLRADPDLLSPIQQGSEQAQKDLVGSRC
jgi:transposase